MHVKSFGVAERLQEIYQISQSPAREDKSIGFVMKQNVFLWPQLTKDRQSLSLLMPTTTAGLSSIKLCVDRTIETWLNSVFVPWMLCSLYVLNERSIIIAH